MNVNSKVSINGLYIKIIEINITDVSNSWFRVSHDVVCIKYLERLYLRGEVPNIYLSQELEISIW